MQHGASDQPPPRDSQLIELFQRRDGLATVVVLRDGQRLTVHNIAWGYDMGDQFAHVTSNISPFVAGEPIEFFFTSEVRDVLDPAGTPLLRMGDEDPGEHTRGS